VQDGTIRGYAMLPQTRILRERADRGHSIDFYGRKGHAAAHSQRMIGAPSRIRTFDGRCAYPRINRPTSARSS